MTFLECLESCLGLYSCRPCRPNAEAPNDFERGFQKTMFLLSCLTVCTGAGVGCAVTNSAYPAACVAPYVGALNGGTFGSMPFFARRRDEESLALLADESLPDPNVHVLYTQPGANLSG